MNLQWQGIGDQPVATLILAVYLLVLSAYCLAMSPLLFLVGLFAGNPMLVAAPIHAGLAFSFIASAWALIRRWRWIKWPIVLFSLLGMLAYPIAAAQNLAAEASLDGSMSLQFPKIISAASVALLLLTVNALELEVPGSYSRRTQ
jgi:hypothetical protein